MRTDQPTPKQTWPWGILVLRVVVGLTFFMHGQQKLFDNGIDGVEQFFASLGIPLPGLSAVVVTLVETVGGLALIIGLFTRLIAFLLAIDNLVATLVVHLENGFFISPNSFGVELTLLLLAANIALILAGPGALAVDNLLPIERSLPWCSRSVRREGEAW